MPLPTEWIVLIGLAVFWGILAVLRQFYNKPLLDRGVEITVPIVMVRTKRFNNLLDRIGRSWVLGWRVLATVGVAMGFGLMLYASRFLLQNILALFINFSRFAPVTLLIPGITISVSLDTLLHLIIALLLIIVVHEGAHGVIARAEKIPVKSAGLVLFLAIPGAFVEPDDDALMKCRKSSQLRFFAAGSAANIGLGLLFYLFVTSSFTFYWTVAPFYHPSSGVLVTGVMSDGPSANILFGGDVITAVNGTPMVTVEDFHFYRLERVPANSTVLLQLVRNGTGMEIPFLTGMDPGNKQVGYFGVLLFSYYEPRFPSLGMTPDGAGFVYSVERLTALLSVSIGMFNMLPMYAFDGDWMAKLLIGHFIKGEKPAKYSLNLLRIFAISLIAANVIVTYATRGMVSL